MAILEIEYSGDDLVISKETAEKTLGLHPGDRVEVRPKTHLKKALKRSPDESKAIADAFDRLRNAYEPSDLEDWETHRKALWAKWNIRI